MHHVYLRSKLCWGINMGFSHLEVQSTVHRKYSTGCKTRNEISFSCCVIAAIAGQCDSRPHVFWCQWHSRAMQTQIVLLLYAILPNSPMISPTSSSWSLGTRLPGTNNSTTFTAIPVSLVWCSVWHLYLCASQRAWMLNHLIGCYIRWIVNLM